MMKSPKKMESGKFLRLFGTLTKQDRTAFRKYLRSRYADCGVPLRIHEYLHKAALDRSEARQLDMTNSYEKIFGEAIDEQPHNRTRLLNALSDLYGWLREFLLLRMLKSEQVETQFLWLAMLRQQGLESEYTRKAWQMLDTQQKSPKPAINAYLREVVAGYLFYFETYQNKQPDDVVQLEQCIPVLEIYFAVTRLKIACEIESSKRIYDRAYQAGDMEAVLHIAQRFGAQHPLLALYYETYLLLTEDPDGNFGRVTELLMDNYAGLDKDEVHVLVGFIRNHKMRRNDGSATHWKSLQRLNAILFDRGVLPIRLGVSPREFLTYVTIATRAGDMDWAKRYIDEQGQFLKTNKPERAIGLTQATLAFETENYAEVVTLLKGEEFKDVVNMIRVKSLLLRSHYELNTEPDLLLDLCRNFMASLRRRDTPRKNLILGTKHFVRLTRLLIEKKLPQPTLLAKIQETNPLQLKEWLLKKAEVYKK